MPVQRHHGLVTDDTGTPLSQLPPDPAAYDSPRGVAARRRGLPAPYIAGGDDPDPEQGLREERKYTRWLIWMVVALVFGGFVLGILIAIVTGNLAGNLI
jgi:hypothetical protein